MDLTTSRGLANLEGSADSRQEECPPWPKRTQTSSPHLGSVHGVFLYQEEPYHRREPLQALQSCCPTTIESGRPDRQPMARPTAQQLIRWLTRSRRFQIAAGAMAMYALVGFFAVPWAIRTYALPAVEEKLGTTVSAERIATNPFLLTLTLEKVALNGYEASPLFAFGGVHVDLEWSSLFRWGFVFRDISFQAPSIEVRRGRDGRVNLEALVKRVLTEEKSTESAEPPRLWIHALSVIDGRIAVVDAHAKPTVRRDIAPISFQVDRLTTRGSEEGKLVLEAISDHHERFRWDAQVDLVGLSSKGVVDLKAVHLDKYRPYTRGIWPVRFTSGFLDVSVPYEIALSKDGIRFAVEKLAIKVKDARFQPPSETSPSVAVKTLSLSGGSFRYPETTASLGTILADGVVVAGGRLSEDGDLNLLKLLPKARRSQDTDEEASELNALILRQFTLRNSSVEVAHAFGGRELPLRLGVESVTLERTNLVGGKKSDSSAYAADLVFGEGSQVHLQGTVSAPGKTVTLDYEVKGIPLADLGPYASMFAQVEVNSGRFSARGHASGGWAPALMLQHSGNAKVEGLTMTGIQKNGGPLLRLTELSVENISASYPGPKVRIERIGLNGIQVFLTKSTSGEVNLAALQPQASTSKPKASTSPMDIAVQEVRLSKTRITLVDRSVEPPMTEVLGGVHGVAGPFSTQQGRLAHFRVSGRVGEYAPFQFSGNVLPLAPKRRGQVQFRMENLDMPRFTPYSGKFAGYAIEKGKLNTEASYQVQNGKLEGENHVLIDQFGFGEEVESQDATSLPVKLGVALLTDRNGKIDLDVPVSGDVNDPEFSFGGLIWQAIGNLLEAAVVAPFSAIGSLFDSGPDQTSAPTLVFQNGETALSSEAQAALKQLEATLYSRPGVRLNVAPEVGASSDLDALKRAELNTILSSIEQQDDFSVEINPGQERERALREAYARAKSPTGAMLRPFDGDDAILAVAASAPTAEVQAFVLSKIAVPKEALERLSRARADAVLQTLLASKRLPPEQVFLLQSKKGTSPGVLLSLEAK
jgi:hypothetical protein